VFAGRAYPVTAPQLEMNVPYAVWFRQHDETDVWCANANIETSIVEVYLYAKSYDLCASLAGQAMTALKTVVGYERGAQGRNGFDEETQFFEWQISANFTRVI
jgi:hypothetical protein